MMEIVQFICEIGNISSQLEIYQRKILIYLRIIRFIDFSTKTTKKKPNKKPPIYVLVETVGVEPTSRHNGT